MGQNLLECRNMSILDRKWVHFKVQVSSKRIAVKLKVSTHETTGKNIKNKPEANQKMSKAMPLKDMYLEIENETRPWIMRIRETRKQGIEFQEIPRYLKTNYFDSLQEFDIHVESRAAYRAEFDKKIKEKEMIYKRYRDEAESAKMVLLHYLFINRKLPQLLSFQKRQDPTTEYIKLGVCNQVCEHCGALFGYDERLHSHSKGRAIPLVIH
ncbi:targeting protein for XKLP2 [Artemisia annua]|uniref:Targeting protein for XKLP2 n=1 Tax=Artemisia annua TaxID=35608 RepID=A0A2U1PIW5_ARTAN|nr:targeting protein for XKLP2 [Artemisia annua]